jgi:hypothetical protein
MADSGVGTWKLKGRLDIQAYAHHTLVLLWKKSGKNYKNPGPVTPTGYGWVISDGRMVPEKIEMDRRSFITTLGAGALAESPLGNALSQVVNLRKETGRISKMKNIAEKS